MTRQRRVILDELMKVKSHPTADEVYEMVRKKLPSISLATVYRNLEDLSNFGAIQKIKTGGNLKRFDATTDDHVHIRCMKCGRVDDVHKNVLNNEENNVGQLGACWGIRRKRKFQGRRLSEEDEQKNRRRSHSYVDGFFVKSDEAERMPMKFAAGEYLNRLLDGYKVMGFTLEFFGVCSNCR